MQDNVKGVRSNPLPPGEGGREAPGEGSNAKSFVSRALNRAPTALCPLPEGEGLGVHWACAIEFQGRH